MQNVFKNLAYAVVGFVVMGIAANLTFAKHVLNAQSGLLSLQTQITDANKIEATAPWYQFIYYDQEFVNLESQTFVVIAKQKADYTIVPSSRIFKLVWSSPTLLMILVLAILLVIAQAKGNRREKVQHEALKAINNDLNALLKGLDIKHKELHSGGPVAQICYAVQSLSDNLQRIKIQSDSHVYQDKLTKLIDRHAYIEHISEQLTIADQNKSKCGLLFIDLDGFKQVNDSFGHSFGDEILIQVSGRLEQVVRQFKLNDAHPVHGLDQNLSRLGGDEFSIFIPNLRDTSFCTEVAQMILSEVERDFVLGNKLVKISASIGIAVFPDSASTPNALLQMSDVAMYRAKTDGRGIFRVYSPEMGNKIRRYHYLLEELRLAIASQNFQLSFQPIVHVEDCSIDYFEALTRWHHPIEGVIPPSEFIPIAEESNLILELGDWILLESCRQMSAWHNAGMKKVKISVNVSGIQLKHRPVYDWILEALEKSGLPATSLMIEITESTLITASDEIIAQLERCRSAGITIAIDDFGTGFSSLSTLADLPIDVIKIDKLFISQAKDNPKYFKILNSISELGAQLGLKIVAEGVEQLDQFELVKNMGICCVQGYLVSRPETSRNVGDKVLKGNVNHIASTGTSVWLPKAN
ncbi:putative bifunctional diguanylate cyclase/phosphodiesterase [Pseudoalteromonas luteoviolacea]|uniref:putative bifunctional diguanylate cyclase/phosphodiesterase n=1 Tax=Pseudoalteromonas luteoviolacea TaxID=43657 RepID=UPI001B369045|nr:EAL domain-containing protein [Pseudoalteromonas luteoviolacea]MBQ4835079.1 EAL domain-containing protein [Pseudoalteromonas luteoviolacea]